jgi:hypothetical protein
MFLRNGGLTLNDSVNVEYCSQIPRSDSSHGIACDVQFKLRFKSFWILASCMYGCKDAISNRIVMLKPPSSVYMWNVRSPTSTPPLGPSCRYGNHIANCWHSKVVPTPRGHGYVESSGILDLGTNGGEW